MKIQENLKEYGRFLEKQEETKQLVKQQLMTSNLGLITSVMVKSGWMVKGKGNVTDTMVKGNVFTCDYLKNFKGEKVQVTIRVNINDDYISSSRGGGYNEFILRNGYVESKQWNPPIERWWHKGKDIGISVEFNENEDRKMFHLKTHLETIEELYK